MLEVKVSKKAGNQTFTGIVRFYGYDKLTPRAARAALEIAGYNTGEAWSIEPPMKAICMCVAEGGPDLPCTPAEWCASVKAMGRGKAELSEHFDQDDEGREVAYWTDNAGQVVLREVWQVNTDPAIGYRVYKNSARKLYEDVY